MGIEICITKPIKMHQIKWGRRAGSFQIAVWFTLSILEKGCDIVDRQAGKCCKFLHTDELILLFGVGFSDFIQKRSSIFYTFPGNPLYILRINNDTICSHLPLSTALVRLWYGFGTNETKIGKRFETEMTRYGEWRKLLRTLGNTSSPALLHVEKGVALQ